MLRLFVFGFAIWTLFLRPSMASAQCTPSFLSFTRDASNMMVANAASVECPMTEILSLGLFNAYPVASSGAGVRYLSGPGPINVLIPSPGSASPGTILLSTSTGGSTVLQFTIAGVYVLRGFETGTDADPMEIVDITLTVPGFPCVLYSVVLDTLDSPLDANPNAGGGLRVFYGKAFPASESSRSKVKVSAVLTTPTPGVELFFRSFDLDDPSSDAVPVDPNNIAGGDNRGAPQEGTLSAMSALTDATGTASVEFSVTSQPGDNFRIAASCEKPYLDGVVVEVLDLRDAEGVLLPTEDGKQTEMLTVWRRVHVELDSMGPVKDNHLAGTVRIVNPDLRPGRTGSLVVLDERTGEPDQYAGGRIVTAAGAFPVIGSAGSVLTTSVLVPVEAEKNPFTLYDDDDFNRDDGANKDGDEGEDLPAPDISLIQDSDDPAQNVYAPAYVRPTYDLGGDDSVPFVLNVATDDAAGVIATYAFDNVGTEADPDFWTVYLLGAYQYVVERDADGRNESATLGIVDDINGLGANVFAESLAEFAPKPLCTSATTAAHEVGHLFFGSHGRHGFDGGLMDQCGDRTSLSFTAATLAKIRSVLHP